MLISYIRALILLLLVVAVLRIMGKRQIGQLQPTELVVTILLSEIAATPMQDNDIPIGNTVIAIFVLVGAEILMSAFNMKSIRMRALLQGNSIMIIKNGVLDQAQMKRLRFTLDDLLEELRQKNVFDISDVEYAIVETDGALSVFLKPGKRKITNDDMNIQTADNGIPCVLVMDGKVINRDFNECGMNRQKLNDIISNSGRSIDEILLLTADRNGNTNIIFKEEGNV